MSRVASLGHGKPAVKEQDISSNHSQIPGERPHCLAGVGGLEASFQTLHLHASCCHLVFDRANDGREDCASNTAARDLSDQCADIDVVRWAGKNWNERSEYLSAHTTPDRTDN